MEMKLELVPVPVSDVDVAIDFYTNKVGFVLDHDIRVDDEIRFVQLTPPGSACSIVLGEGVTEMVIGSQKGLQVVVKDARETAKALAEKGVKVAEIEELSWGIFTYFSDPDGNSWAVQEMVPYTE